MVATRCGRLLQRLVGRRSVRGGCCVRSRACLGRPAREGASAAKQARGAPDHQWCELRGTLQSRTLATLESKKIDHEVERVFQVLKAEPASIDLSQSPAVDSRRKVEGKFKGGNFPQLPLSIRKYAPCFRFGGVLLDHEPGLPQPSLQSGQLSH
jgi:hypothetical protein